MSIRPLLFAIRSLAVPRFWGPITLALLGLAPALLAGEANGIPSPETRRLRLAFSAGVIGEINHNDAKASMIAWGHALMVQHLTQVEKVEPNIFENPAELFRAVQEGSIDGAAVMTDELLSRPASLAVDSLYVTVKNGKITVQYVLLVHQDSGIAALADLRGKSLELHKSSRTSLAAPWLDLRLADQGLGPAESVFRKIDRSEEASRTVLHAFFRQADAVVVTRDAFDTMRELNPQIGKELRVLAVSPEVVPSLFFLRPDFTGSLRTDLETAIATLHDTVAGRQALTVFQGDRLQRAPLSILQSSIDLMAAHARLPRSRPAGPAPARGF